MRTDLLSSLWLTGLTIAICAVAYPLLILVVATVIAPEARLGSLVTGSGGQVVGSRLVAQGFSRPEYFWPRPSAVDYDAAAAGGSNLSPANPAIRGRAESIVARLGVSDNASVSADLVTASGSGLDPHISYAAAVVQASRVATSRNLREDEVVRLIDQHAEKIPMTTDVKIVNVLELNIALDAVQSNGRQRE